MVQNFKAEQLKEFSGCKPLKATLGGMSANEMLFLYNFAQNADKTKKYIINMDLHRIASENEICADSGRFPDYMFNYKGLNKFKYLLGYETWFKFIPYDVALNISGFADKYISSSLLEKIDENTDINSMCEWDNSILPGKEILLNYYRENVKFFDEGDNSIFSPNAIKNIEKILNEFYKTLDDDEELSIFLPPYSILYWADWDDAHFETLLKMREAIVKSAKDHSNVTVLDFQGIEEINNLDLYFDQNHYGKELCSYTEKMLFSEKYSATESSVKKSSEYIKNSREIIKNMEVDYN